MQTTHPSNVQYRSQRSDQNKYKGLTYAELIEKLKNGEAWNRLDIADWLHAIPWQEALQFGIVPEMVQMYLDVNSGDTDRISQAKRFREEYYEVMLSLQLLNFFIGEEIEMPEHLRDRIIHTMETARFYDSYCAYGKAIRTELKDNANDNSEEWTLKFPIGNGRYDDIIRKLALRPALMASGPNGHYAGVNIWQLCSFLMSDKRVDEHIESYEVACDFEERHVEYAEIISRQTWEDLVHAVQQISPIEPLDRVCNNGVTYVIVSRYSDPKPILERPFMTPTDEEAMYLAGLDTTALIGYEHLTCHENFWEIAASCDAYGLVPPEADRYLFVSFDWTDESIRKMHGFANSIPKKFVTVVSQNDGMDMVREHIDSLRDYIEYPNAFYYKPSSKTTRDGTYAHIDWQTDKFDLERAIQRAKKTSTAWIIHDIIHTILSRPLSKSPLKAMTVLERSEMEYDLLNELVLLLGCGYIDYPNIGKHDFVRGVDKNVRYRIIIDGNYSEQEIAADEQYDVLLNIVRYIIGELFETEDDGKYAIHSKRGEELNEVLPTDLHDRFVALANIMHDEGLEEYLRAWKDGVPPEDLFA